MDKAMTTARSNINPTALRGARQREYTDPGTFERELARIFDRDWVMVGRHGTIPEPGNYMTATLGKRPIVCIREGWFDPLAISPASRFQLLQAAASAGSSVPAHGPTRSLVS
jgi:hypothetical protein